VKNRIVVWALVGLLSACSSLGNKDEDDLEPYKNSSAKILYTESKQSIGKGEYTDATKRLEALGTLYPFSPYAERAQLDLVYAYYKKEDYASAAATAEQFTRLYPRAERVDYAYYMKGLAHFQQPRGTLTKVFPLDESWRDPGTQSQAYSDFATLVERFPKSRYKANALQRMIYLRNEFAQKELNVAQYYFDHRMYVAASERASYLVKTYPEAPSAAMALVMLYRAKEKLGLMDAANEARHVYEATYHRKISGAG